VSAVIAAQPYPWPWDGSLVPQRLAVIVAGAQVAFVHRSVASDDVRSTIGAVCTALRPLGATVVLLRHGAPGADGTRSGLPPRPGTPGWDLTHPLGDGDVMVDCTGFDGFFGSSLDAVLRARGIDQLILCGYGAEATVDSTLRSANDRGYECLTLTDAGAGFDPALLGHAHSSIIMSGGIFGAIATSEALLAALPVPALEAT
jgi:biuret amidohydrolase